jgi:hypothetical protein
MAGKLGAAEIGRDLGAQASDWANTKCSGPNTCKLFLTFFNDFDVFFTREVTVNKVLLKMM